VVELNHSKLSFNFEVGALEQALLEDDIEEGTPKDVPDSPT
jgi:hypothetical protein